MSVPGARSPRGKSSWFNSNMGMHGGACAAAQFRRPHAPVAQRTEPPRPKGRMSVRLRPGAPYSRKNHEAHPLPARPARLERTSQILLRPILHVPSGGMRPVRKVPGMLQVQAHPLRQVPQKIPLNPSPMLKCHACGSKIAGNLVQCLVHDGWFCDRCGDCPIHEPKGA